MYGREFAEIYDLIHRGRGKDYHAEAAFVADLIRARAPQARSLVDIACATGAHLVAFAELFDEVAGVEISEPMVQVARKKFDGEVVHLGDMRSFDLGRGFDAVTCMFGSIGHTMAEAELDAALACFARHLNPGGVLVVDPWWFAETFTDGYIAGDVVEVEGLTVARVSHATRVGDKSRMEVHYTVARPEGITHFAETYLASLYTRQQYEDAFTRAGLTADYLPGVQNGRGAFVAAKH
ncbi:class I SAM-dependent DNA methyltransferase [Actinokineospora diospyrosa]|uniref:Methyltransferase domain-containing protein n=1 Tax=Actinokineospora diospyrosa TaxID=103728 RepID=A0ABT1I815_9PSEU|nr:class I SAM-dependent methyltransferase [Actinokineospora diospyrosa]MCP2268768.1 Methyltransferase domain-containing protein [Actinokineospora diospyrosa]